MKIMLLDTNTDCYITVAKTNYKCMLIPSMTKLSNYKSHYGLLLHFLDGILQIKYPKPCAIYREKNNLVHVLGLWQVVRVHRVNSRTYK